MAKAAATMESKFKLIEQNQEEDREAEVVILTEETDRSEVEKTTADIKPTGESSLPRSQEFFLKKNTLFKECREKNVLLEALITSVILDNNTLADVFESGVAKAAHFSDFGDIQTTLNVIKRWSAKLHTKSGRKNSQQDAWCHKNGIKKERLHELDNQLRECYRNVQSYISDAKATAIAFRNDETFVHETITQIMSTLWHDHLCVYRGQKDFGYLQISSKCSILIGRKSCIRLTNEPPAFALCYFNGDISHDRENGYVESNIIVRVGDDLANRILSKNYGTTSSEIIAHYTLLPIIVQNIGFTLGSLVESENLAEHLHRNCKESVEISYNSDLKQLNVFSPQPSHVKVQSALEVELERLRQELETKIIWIPYPNYHSPLRLEIGPGFKCSGISGIRIFTNELLPGILVQNTANPSIPLETAELLALHMLENSHQVEENEEDIEVISSNEQQLLLTVYSAQYDEPLDSRNMKKPSIFCDDVVAFDTSVEVSVIYSMQNIKTRHTDTENLDLVKLKDLRCRAIFVVSRTLAEGGLRIDGGQNSTMIWAYDPINEHQVVLKIKFPNLNAAQTGLRCMKRNISLCIQNPGKVERDIRSIRIAIRNDLYHVIRESLHEKLKKLHQESICVSYEETVCLKRQPETKMIMNIQISYGGTFCGLLESLDDVFRPQIVKALNRTEMCYLRSNVGQQFLKFLMDFTETYVHFPRFKEEVHIYGDSSKARQAEVILRNQLEKDSYPKNKWHLIDFGKACFTSNAMKTWFQKLKPCTEELVSQGDIQQYYVSENCPQLWVETSLEVFQCYSDKVKTTLHKVVEKTSSRETGSQVICAYCLVSINSVGKSCYILSVCGHAYCSECIILFVRQSVKNQRLPITCASADCNKSFSACELHYFCGELQYFNIEALIRHLLNAFVIENSTIVRNCPNSKCRGMGLLRVKEQRLDCFWCRRKFCTLCDRKFHGQLPCEPSFSIEDWINEDPVNRKECPKCKMAIEKVDGCNCVHCTWCKWYMCWNCAKFHDKCSTVSHTHIRNCR